MKIAHFSNNVVLGDIVIPDYSNYITIYNSASDCEDQTYTIPENGWLLIRIDVRTNAGSHFYRLYINDGLMLQYNDKVEKDYCYFTSEPIPVRKGDVIKYSLSSGETTGSKKLYLLRPR